jgi:cytidyltransferase-like protein
VTEEDDHPRKREFCAARGIELRVISNKALGGFPGPPPDLTTQLSSSPADPSKKKVIVTGCYDWFHSGHVRFFEEASAYGDLYVDVGSDANIRLLKGEGHPLFPQAERLYMVRAVRNVCRAFIGTGAGWMDAVPEIELLKPDFYVVNEDGDRPEKREFCAGRGIEYVVLKRTPKEGLPRRDSTTLRGF